MGTIKKEDIIGIMLNGKTVCKDCASDDDWNAAKETDFLTKDLTNIEDIGFCDECGEMIFS